jgi:alpha-L-fucosidase
VGPTAEGVIIKPMVDRLLEVGRWLKHSGPCVYATVCIQIQAAIAFAAYTLKPSQDYSFRGAEGGPHLRFTTTKNTFCIISLARPENGVVVIDAAWRVPILLGDTISLLGAGVEGESLLWWQKEGKLVISVGEEVLERVKWAWAFQITYNTVKEF